LIVTIIIKFVASATRNSSFAGPEHSKIIHQANIVFFLIFLENGLY